MEVFYAKNLLHLQILANIFQETIFFFNLKKCAYEISHETVPIMRGLLFSKANENVCISVMGPTIRLSVLGGLYLDGKLG